MIHRYSIQELMSTALISFLAIMAIAGCGPSSRPISSAPSVVLLGLDGLDPEVVGLLMAEGKLPNLSRMREEGAWGVLRAEPPLLSPILWTTIATGKPAREHGIGHFVATDPVSGEDVPATSTLRKVEALWNIVSDSGRQVATIGWWATWPPETVRGTVVSDQTAYHFLFPEAAAEAVRADAIAPSEEAERLVRWVRRPDDVDSGELQDFAELTTEEWSRPFDFDDEASHLKWAYATADSYRKIALDLLGRRQPDLLMLYIEATDSVSHLFGHLFRNENLAGPLLEQKRRFGKSVEAMYMFADRIVGEVLEKMPDNGTLIVVSDHGFRLGELPDDPTTTGGLRRRVDDSFHRRDGVILMAGRAVEHGIRIDGATQLDVAPTVLTLLGLEVPRDMPGRVLERAVQIEIADRRLDTYESGQRESNLVTSEPEIAASARRRLEALGYLDTVKRPEPEPVSDGTISTQGEINLAALAFREGRFDEAIERYLALLESMPNEVRLHISLAAAYSGAENYEKATEHLEEALRRDSSDPRAHYNLGMLAELRGEPGEAVGRYRTSLRYQPEFEPSLQALARLGESPPGAQIRSQEERQALALCDQARESAKRGGFDEAARIIERAVELAPRSAVVLQYRSNIAYLRGDYETAIDSLENALEIEPDNILFQRNLRRLRDRTSAKAVAEPEGGGPG